MTPAEAAAYCRAGISRLRQQAEAATPGPWVMKQPEQTHLAEHVIFGHAGTHPDALTHVANVEMGWRRGSDGVHIVTWQPSAVLALCELFDQQVEALEATLAEHEVTKSAAGSDYCDRCGWWISRQCPDRRRAEAGLSSLAAVVSQILGNNGATQ